MLADRYIRTDFTTQEEFERDFTLTIPEHFHFAYDVVDEYARLSPDKRAMIWCDLHGRERTFTFGEFSRLSDRAANVFKAQGLRRGDPVLLMLKRRYQFWIAALGLLKLGCVLIPATAQLQKKDIVYRVQASSACAILCVEEPEVQAHVRAAGAECDTLKALLTLDDAEGFLNFDRLLETADPVWEKPAELPANDDLMLLYFTSGTTGMPKMAAHTWTYPIAQTVTAYYWHHVGDDDIHLAVADTGWAKAGWGKMYGQWICGATLFVYDFDHFVATDLLEKLAHYRVTSFCAPPTVYRFMIKEDLSRYDLSALRWANCAGEPLNPEVYEQFHRATGVKIHEAFGQSETTPLLMTSKWMEPKTGSTGRPSPAYDIALVNEAGEPVDDGVEGEICIRMHHGHPPGLFVGYYRNQEQTDAVFYNDLYHTGDMAWRDVDGYFFFIGRSDDVIKSSGYRIGPFEVESALLTHPAVLECAITAVPHPERGQVVKATVVLAPNRGYTPSDELKRELQEHVKAVTAPYKYPRIIEFVEELPKTISGKIQRKLIRNQDEELRERMNRMNLVCLGVRDMTASLRFYRDGLGFRTKEKSDTPQVVFFSTPGTKLELYSLQGLAEDINPDNPPAIGQGFGGITLAYNAHNKDEVRAMTELARRAGARIVKEPQDVFWGGYHSYFADPDGYYWEIAWNPEWQLDDQDLLKL